MSVSGRSRWWSRLAVATVGAVGFTCGSDRCNGDSGGATGEPLVIEAVEPTGWASTEGGFNSNHAELRCGDDGRGATGDYQYYPALTFDLTSAPAGSSITSALLRIYQVRADGDAPYGSAQHEVVVEHVSFTQMWQADEVAPIAGTIGQRLVSDVAAVGWRSADVTEAVTSELAAGRTRVQLRLRFAPAMAHDDGAIDWAVFASNDAVETTQRPTLAIVHDP